MIELHLLHLAVSYDTWVEQTRHTADYFKQLADDPEFRDQVIEYLNPERLAQGLEPLTDSDPEVLQSIAEYFQRSADDVDDNEAERKMALRTWQELTEPLLDYANLWPIMEDDSNNLPRPPM